jgi:NAD+-dependent protein deacetylase sirtuin 4
MRIPYTGALPPPIIVPPSAATLFGAVEAITSFLTLPATRQSKNDKTVLLTGAGISVASGLADYRGANGTYTQNRSYRPIYYHEFTASHEARKRYWARSFLGWSGLDRSQPNASHFAIRDLHRLGYVQGVVTQNVDSFHNHAHPGLRTVELHGFLRKLVCLSCRRLMDRQEFQDKLAKLNPAWAEFLKELLESGALDTENPEERRKLGYRTNPDGDADVPGAPYNMFRYPACPHCLARAPVMKDGRKGIIDVDSDGAWKGTSNAGILKPNVIMFGESIPEDVKKDAEELVSNAGRLLVVGSSLATYSAWRLVKGAVDQEMGVGVLNVGGVRKEEVFFPKGEGVRMGPDDRTGDKEWLQRVRVGLASEEVLPAVVQKLRGDA